MEQNTQKNALRWLWQVSGRYKGCIAALLVLDIILSLTGVASALLFRALVDGAVAGSLQRFVRAALLLVALQAAGVLINALYRFLYEWTSVSLENRIKRRMFSCLLHKDYAAVMARHSGDWMSRLVSDTSVVTGGLTDILPGLGGMLSGLAGALVALFALEPAFVFILVPAGLLVVGITAALRKVLKRMHKRVQEANSAAWSFFQERLESMMIIRVFSMEDKTCQQADQKMNACKAARLTRCHFSNFCNFGFQAIADGGYLLAAFYCGYGILRGSISYGTFTAILQLVGRVQSPFASITGVVPQYYAMTASAERIMEVENFQVDDTYSLPVGEAARVYREELRAIGVRDASFSYRTFDGENRVSERLAVIRNLNLEIGRGEYIAFTGHSGCGKSTLLKLLMCLYPLDGGERYIVLQKEGAPAQEQPLTAAWRGLFAYVPQGNQLMSGTIREIVTFGDPDAMQQEERLARALQIACASEFVDTLADGIDTRLGERGSGLSEGQMQRIAIARAIFSERPILILDEATSALDEETERQLLSNLRQMTDKTVLIITHRPAALEICDRRFEMAEP